MKTCTTLVISILLCIQAIGQNAGDLDLSYGTNGISTIPFLFTNSVYDISITSDDRIISGGKYYNLGENNLLSFKFLTDGSLAGFNAGSWFEHSFAQSEIISETYVLPDDKILLAGTYNPSPSSLFLIQLTPDGFLDPAFGTDGIFSAEIDFNPTAINVYYYTGGDYYIYLSGRDEGFTKPSIMKFDNSGSIVTTFGNNGIYEFPLYEGGYYDISIEGSDGSGYIYACGYEISGEHAYISKHDLNTGDLISNFGDNGCVAYESPYENSIAGHAAIYQNTNNSITVFGNYSFESLDKDLYAIRLNASDGSFDNSFGIGGWAALRIATGDEYITDLVMQDDGKYYFSGFTDFYGDRDFMVGRLQENGYLDAAFGTNGITVTDINGEDEARGIEINALQDRIYAGGTSDNMGEDRAASIICYYTDYEVDLSEKDIPSRQSMVVYPNPCKDFVNIKLNSEANHTVKIYDFSGRLVQQKSCAGKYVQVDFRHLDKGVYFITSSDINNTTQTCKIIKQ